MIGAILALTLIAVQLWKINKTINDYLNQRNREQALSDLVADGEKSGDYDDYLKQRKES